MAPKLTAARTFVKSPVTPRSLERFLDQGGSEAAHLVNRMVKAVQDRSPAFITLRAAGSQLSAKHLTPEARAQVLSTRDLDRLEATRAVSLGWSAGPRPMAPPLSGTLRATPQGLALETERGTFALDRPTFANSRYLDHSVLKGFVDQPVSVAGWPTVGADGSRRISVESFAPGRGGPFVSGRVEYTGLDRPRLRIFPGVDGTVELRLGPLEGRLAVNEGMGLILPLEIKQDRAGRYVELDPAADAEALRYYMLATPAEGGGVSFGKWVRSLASGEGTPSAERALERESPSSRRLLYGALTVDNRVIVDATLEASPEDSAAGTHEAEASFRALAEVLPLKEPVVATFAPKS